MREPAFQSNPDIRLNQIKLNEIKLPREIPLAEDPTAVLKRAMHGLNQRPVRRSNVLSDTRHNFFFNRKRQAECAAKVEEAKASEARGSEFAAFHVHSQKAHENDLSDASHVAIRLVAPALQRCIRF